MKQHFIISLIVLSSVTAQSQQPFYDVTVGNGNGIRLWQSDYYKIHMGNTSEYMFGPVTDYSIKMNSNVQPGKGWTWGLPGAVPVAALSNVGNMQIAGSFYTGSVIPDAWGTGRISVSGATAEFSLVNRDVSTFVNSPTNGERWVLYNQGLPDGRLRFWSGGDKMTLTKDGLLGIGTTAPGYKLDVIGVTATQGIRIPNRYTFSQSESAIEVEVPTNSYNAIRGFNGTQHIGTIHFFDDTWGSGQPSQSAGSINLSPLTAVTFGNWSAPIAYFRSADGFVGIGTTSPGNKLTIATGGGTPRLGAAGIQLYNGNSNADSRNWMIETPFSGAGNFNISQYQDAANGWAVSRFLILPTDNYTRSADMTINSSGNVGIGTTSPNQKLTVNGTIYGKEVKVDLNVPGPDYVFEKDYKLPSLDEIKSYIDANKHLPEVPSAKEMEEKGINVGEMNMILLRKVEELTLHLIEQNKLITKLQEQRNASPDESGKKVEELTLMMIELNKANTDLRVTTESQQKRIETLEKKK